MNRLDRMIVAPFLASFLISGASCEGDSYMDEHDGLSQVSAPPVSDSQIQRLRVMQCREQRQEAAEALAAEHRQSHVALVSRLEYADPEEDAVAAGERGDFRLIRGMYLMGTFAMGVECRVPSTNRWQGAPLTLATRFYSDVVGSCETGGGQDPCRTEHLLDAYGPAYNRALVSHPEYPYQDLCRISKDGFGRSIQEVISDPVSYGFSDLELTDRPHDIYEAARRGTKAAVRRMIEGASVGAIDDADPYGLSPLAWAVIERRPEIAAMFLAAGASPIGYECDKPDRKESPLRLALRTGQEDIVRDMLTAEVLKRVTPWPSSLVEAAALGGSTSILAEMLRERNFRVSVGQIAERASSPLPASSEAIIDWFVRGLCWRHDAPSGASVRMLGTYGSESIKKGAPVTVSVVASRPVFLVLTAYAPLEWRIEVARGAEVVGVLAVGVHGARVTGDVAGVPIVINDSLNHCPTLNGGPFYADRIGPQQAQLANRVEKMLGTPISNFQGHYQASAFEIN